MIDANTRGYTLELFQFEEIGVGLVLREPDFERGAEHLVLRHGRRTSVPARRLRHPLKLSG